MVKTKLKKYICITLAISFVMQLLMCVSAAASSPYYSYFISDMDMFSSILSTPDAYQVKAIIDFPDTASGKLLNPEDIFIGPDEKIYIADAGNNRIVVLKSDLTFDFEITVPRMTEASSNSLRAFLLTMTERFLSVTTAISVWLNLQDTEISASLIPHHRAIYFQMISTISLRE